MKRHLVVFALLFVLPVACSAASSPLGLGDAGLSDGCSPGQSQSCQGAGACAGIQRCTSARQWGACECHATPPFTEDAGRLLDAAMTARDGTAPTDGAPSDRMAPPDVAAESALPPDSAMMAPDAEPDVVDDSSTVIPTTCPEADGTIGCCAGGLVYYCAVGATTVSSETCSAMHVCGWNAAKGYYGCVAPPSVGDPSGTYPLGCK